MQSWTCNMGLSIGCSIYQIQCKTVTVSKLGAQKWAVYYPIFGLRDVVDLNALLYIQFLLKLIVICTLCVIITLQCCILARTSLFSPAYVRFHPTIRHFLALWPCLHVKRLCHHPRLQAETSKNNGCPALILQSL